MRGAKFPRQFLAFVRHGEMQRREPKVVLLNRKKRLQFQKMTNYSHGVWALRVRDGQMKQRVVLDVTQLRIGFGLHEDLHVSEVAVVGAPVKRGLLFVVRHINLRRNDALQQQTQTLRVLLRDSVV